MQTQAETTSKPVRPSNIQGACIKVGGAERLSLPLAMPPCALSPLVRRLAGGLMVLVAVTPACIQAQTPPSATQVQQEPLPPAQPQPQAEQPQPGAAPGGPAQSPSPQAAPAQGTPAQGTPAPNGSAQGAPPPDAPAQPPQSAQPQRPQAPVTGGQAKGTETPAVIVDGNTDTLLGKPVKSATGDDMGRVVDVMVDNGGVIRAAIIDFGGFLGVGSRKIAVDWRVLHFSKGGKMETIIADLTRDQLRTAPAYKPGEPAVIIGRADAAPVAVPQITPPTPATSPSAAAPAEPPATAAPEAPARKP